MCDKQHLTRPFGLYGHMDLLIRSMRVARYAAHDPRVRLVDVSPIPVDWNGKAWGLEIVLRHATHDDRWILTIDAACWPSVLRVGADNQPLASGKSAYHPEEARRYLRRAVIDAVRLLRDGEVLAIFPEAYPNVDPSFTPKAGADAFLPFRAGVTRLVELAERDGTIHVQIVPASLAYQQEHGQQYALPVAPRYAALPRHYPRQRKPAAHHRRAGACPLRTTTGTPVSPPQRSEQAVQVQECRKQVIG